MTVLGSGAIYEIRASGGVARCTVINKADVGAEEGARCAQEMDEILRGRVLAAGSAYRGIVFDVRRGPAVFGPKTRENLERLFSTAEATRKRIAVRVGDAAIQRLQFTSLCAERAPTCGKVFGGGDDGDEAWAGAG